MDESTYFIKTFEGYRYHKEIVARHMDYIIHMCRVHPKTFFAELDICSRDESYKLSGRFYVPVNYYCLFQCGYGLADLLVMSSEYLTDMEFARLCYFYTSVKTGDKGTSLSGVIKKLGLQPSFTAIRLYRYEEQQVRYWHRFDFYKVYKMEAMIPILLRHPMRLWRYDNRARNRESLCGGYNYIYSYRLVERIADIGFARLMRIETGIVAPTEAELAKLEPYTKKYGDIRAWKQEFDSTLESLEMDVTLGEKSRAGKYKYFIRRSTKNKGGYSILKTQNPPK